MQIPIEKLKNRPRHIDVNEPVTAFPGLNDQVERGQLSFAASVIGRLEATRSGDVIEITGHLATIAVLNCSRCLTSVTCPLDVQVALTYVAADDVADHTTTEEVELDSDEVGLLTFSGDVIELRADIEQEVVMALPPQPLCGDECRGLCLHCGCNLNEHACDCEPPILHAGLAALKNFKVEKQ